MSVMIDAVLFKVRLLFEDSYLFHILPNIPGALFCSAKLALRAVEAISAELRF